MMIGIITLTFRKKFLSFFHSDFTQYFMMNFFESNFFFMYLHGLGILKKHVVEWKKDANEIMKWSENLWHKLICKIT